MGVILFLLGNQRFFCLCLAFAFTLSLPVAYAHRQRTVSGIVRDAAGPLEGVSVAVKGGNARTATDAAGQYRIQANVGDTLLFRNIGYVEEEAVVPPTVRHI